MTPNATAAASLLPPERSHTILVIDDDLAMRTILSFTLAAFGYLPLVAGNGEEALQIARDHPEIGVVILDVVMPGLSGKKLADQLRINLPGVGVLFCSGHPPEIMSFHGIDLSSDHFMQKPCGAPELERKLEELIAAR